MYVFWRAASTPAIAQFLSPLFLLIMAVILWASLLLTRFLERPGTELIAGPVELISMNWLGLLFFLFVCLFAADLFTGFGFLFPRLAPILRAAALGAGVGLSIIALVQGIRSPVVSDHEIRLAGLPAEDDGLQIAVVSDLHLSHFPGEKWLAARVAQVNALHPDLIILLGDIIEGHRDNECNKEIVTLLRDFSAPLGVWAVTGNHEFYSGLDAALRFLDEAGIKVLRNEWSEVRPGLILAGIDDYAGHRQPADTANLVRQAFADRPAGAATIFLSHRPQRMEEAAAAGAGLMLCAHTHGGQIWPFGYISALFNPLLVGRYEIDGMPVIVSRGTGTWGPRMRLWSRGEILRITLRSR